MVRRGEVDDAPAVLELWSLARSEHAITADRAGDIERLISETPSALFVAESDGGEIVGALLAGWDGWRGNIYRLAVHPAHRRDGIGRQLLAAGEEHLRGLGARRVTALVAHDDDVAGAFWDSAGYPVDSEIGRRVRNL
ncbi:MAG: GNAT family N-acetyltransferase [Solirubrobacterales bacterium]|nr:GNAT family N-acetyltransferase [Solirubrobacterales bacterium]